MEEVPIDEAVQSSRKVLRDTMFAGHYDEAIRQKLKLCLRVLPHHQNTSGFFITIIEKVAEFEGVKLVDPDMVEKETLPLEIQERRGFTFLRCNREDPDIQFIRAYYGLKEDFDCNQLICQDPSMNKILYINKGLSDFLYTDCTSHNLNIVNMGVPLFQRNHSKFAGGECIFRIVQEGIMNIVPYMTKRLVRSSNMQVFNQFISFRYNGIDGLKTIDKQVYDAISDISQGCFAFLLEMPDGKVEAITMHKFSHALSTMIAKECAYNLQMRYLNTE